VLVAGEHRQLDPVDVLEEGGDQAALIVEVVIALRRHDT